MDIQQIDGELNKLFAQKQQWITRIDEEIKELETRLENVWVKRRQETSRDKILRINEEIKTLEVQLSRVYDQKRQEISRIENDMDGLEKQLGVILTPPVIKNLNSLCDRINVYMVNPEHGYPLAYNTTDLMNIILALSVNPKRTNTTSSMIQNNIRAIAKFMCRRIMLGGDSNNKIISFKAADDGTFEILLSLKTDTKYLRIYSVKTPSVVSGGDMQYTINIYLTDR
jgi:Skp family chaperone for outer membrane proteins